MSMLQVSILSCVLILNFTSITEASIITKSSKQECILEDGIKTLENVTCQSKLVVGITVNANEGKSQYIQANVSRVLDNTKKKVKNVELRQPIRIQIVKSPVLINFRLFQVGYVANYPHEEIKTWLDGKRFKCRDFWFSSSNCQITKDYEGNDIFDSQGFCCQCSDEYRGGSERCSEYDDRFTPEEYKNEMNYHGSLSVGHCMAYDNLRYFVMALYPPDLMFSITVDIEKRLYLNVNGTGVWERVSKLNIGPHQKIAVSDSHNVKVEYVADFYPSTFVPSEKLVHRYLLVPDMSTFQETAPFPDISEEEWTAFGKSLKNVSEWMAVNKKLFDMSGFKCDKIGVSHTAFRNQNDGCRKPFGSCLRNQPYLLWKEDKTRQKERIQGLYMLHNFGKIHSLPHNTKRTEFQVNFVADRPTTSLMVITLAADDIRVITRVAPGRIVSAYINSFEALSTTGLLLAVIQNIGTFTSTYNVYVQHCSAGVDLVPSKMVSINPRESKNVTFVIHSFHSIGKINYCQLNLFDVNNKRIDNMTVVFETLDTCFCYGFCGCSCGYNLTVCPDAPERENSSVRAYIPSFGERLAKFTKQALNILLKHGSKIAIMFWVFLLLIFLGVLKVIHMIITQEVNMNAVVEPTQIIMEYAKAFAEYIYEEFLPMICDNLWTSCINCCFFCCRKCMFVITCGAISRHEREVARHRIERGWRAPPHCNGMCDGAKFMRRVHRKLMRTMKRAGRMKDRPWWSRPYNCTCKVKDQMPCVKICLGLFFFIYCPFIPLWWLLEFCFKFVKRKWRRRRRIKKFRAERAERETKKQQIYLHLDQYSRGQLEGEIVNLDKELKLLRQLEKEHEADMIGFNPEYEELKLEETSDREGRNMSSDGSLSDTSDPEQANDIDELLVPGFPVYFNYAIPNKSQPLKHPGNNYSIKGRLTRRDTNVYVFELYIYKAQVKQQVNDKVIKLIPPKHLQDRDFVHVFKDASQALKLVTLTPLFPCLNEELKTSNPQLTRRKKT